MHVLIKHGVRWLILEICIGIAYTTSEFLIIPYTRALQQLGHIAQAPCPLHPHLPSQLGTNKYRVLLPPPSRLLTASRAPAHGPPAFDTGQCQ